MKVLIYDVAASESGALSVLEDFYSEACKDSDSEYVFVVSTPEFSNTKNVRVLRYPTVKRSWLHRLWFDMVRAPSIVKAENPDSVISLQNTMIPKVRIPQTVYEHNCMFKPFTKYRFSLIEEPNLWIRQNIIGPIVSYSLKHADNVIVQTLWMKKLCIDNLHIDDSRIEVLPPIINIEARGSWSSCLPVTFFYPSTSLKFKNHEIILDALQILKEKTMNCHVIFTLRGDENSHSRALKERAVKQGLPVEFVGWMDRKDVLATYERTILLFTSFIESSPLPLKEAMAVGAPVIAPDCDYARESLAGYAGARYYLQDSAKSLAEMMVSAIESAMKAIGDISS